jgi:hypothetical protein
MDYEGNILLPQMYVDAPLIWFSGPIEWKGKLSRWLAKLVGTPKALFIYRVQLLIHQIVKLLTLNFELARYHIYCHHIKPTK